MEYITVNEEGSGLVDCDLTWIDGSGGGMGEQEGIEGDKLEAEGSKVSKGNRTQVLGKYKGNKGWKRLVQEVGRRKLL